MPPPSINTHVLGRIEPLRYQSGENLYQKSCHELAVEIRAHERSIVLAQAAQ